MFVVNGTIVSSFYEIVMEEEFYSYDNLVIAISDLSPGEIELLDREINVVSRNSSELIRCDVGNGIDKSNFQFNSFRVDFVFIIHSIILSSLFRTQLIFSRAEKGPAVGETIYRRVQGLGYTK